MVILEPDDVFFAECPVCNLHDDSAFLGGQPVYLFFPDAEYLPFPERYRELLFALVHRGCRISLDKKPPLFAMMVILQAQALFWLYIDSFEVPFAPLIPSVIFAPWSDTL